MNVGGQWTKPLFHGNDSITVINALERLSTVNVVTVQIERTDSTDSNHRHVSNTIYIIGFLNSVNWSPDGFDISVNGFSNDGNNNENNGNESRSNILWRPSFGNTSLILVEHSSDLENEIVLTIKPYHNMSSTN